MSQSTAEFRADARAWLETNTPAEPMPHAGPAAREFLLAWQKRQFEGVEIDLKNGRRAAQGACPTCGTTMNRILGKPS